MPFDPHSTYRGVQALVVVGTNVMNPKHQDIHALSVYNIPDAEQPAFLSWLERPLSATATEAEQELHERKQRFRQRMSQTGFTPQDPRTKLTAIADAFKREYPHSRIGWVTVPMRPGSVVLFRGIHCVRGGNTKTARDNGYYRTVLYLNLCPNTDRTQLPTPSEEVLGALGRRSVNRAIDPAIAAVRRSNGQAYGHNTETIAPEHHACYVNNGQQDKAPYVADTPAMVALRTQGFAVLDGCLSDTSATKLHGALMQGVRDMLAGIPRPGQTPEVRQRILASTNEEMVRDCYTDPEWKTSRYFKRNKLELYTVKPKANTQGAHGLTNTSGMFDVVSDPAFADAQVEMHSRLRTELGWPQLFYEDERGGFRGPGSTELTPHQDDPVALVGNTAGATAVAMNTAVATTKRCVDAPGASAMKKARVTM